MDLNRGPSTATPVWVAAGALPSDNPAWVSNANRAWMLATLGLAANLPQNGQRCGVTVDATRAGVDAFVVFGDNPNPSDSQSFQYVPAGTLWEMPHPYWKGPMSVGVVATTGGKPVIVLEKSYQ